MSSLYRLFLSLGLFLFLGFPSVVNAAFIAPLQGTGNFPASFEVLNRWQDDGTLDLLVMVEVNNTHINFREEDKGLVGRLRLEVQLNPLEREPIEVVHLLRTPSLSRQDAANGLLHQIFGVVIKDVPVRAGRLSMQLYDVLKFRQGLIHHMKRQFRRSECSVDWYAEDSPRPDRGLALEDPLFLFMAPLKTWNPASPQFSSTKGGSLYDYMHPSRRYGLIQDHLQMFLPVWPTFDGMVDSSSTGASSTGYVIFHHHSPGIFTIIPQLKW